MFENDDRNFGVDVAMCPHTYTHSIVNTTGLMYIDNIYIIYCEPILMPVISNSTVGRNFSLT